MPLPRYRAGPVDYWWSEAVTEFLNGFISGWRQGVGTGAGTGILTGVNPEVANNLTAWQQILISGGATLFAMIMAGMNRVSSWHENGHPLPNPWPAPTGSTTPPFPSTPTTPPAP
jgi:hypothetical protein